MTITREGRDFVLIDTAGIRRRGSIQNSVEFYSQARAEKTIRRSNVALLLLDAAAEIGTIDKKIAAYVARHYKGLLIGVNKWDLVPGDVKAEAYKKYIRDRLRGPSYAPFAFLSAKKGRNVEGTFARTLERFVQMRQRAATAEVNRVLRDALERRTPAPHHGRLPKVYIATQIGVVPPTIVLFLNDPKSLGKD